MPWLDLVSIQDRASSHAEIEVTLPAAVWLLLLDASVWYEDSQNWVGASGKPTDAEKDQIDQLVADAIAILSG